MARPELISVPITEKQEPAIHPRIVARETSNVLDLFFSHELEDDMGPAQVLLATLTIPFIDSARIGLARRPDIVNSIRTIPVEELMDVYGAIKPSTEPYAECHQALSYAVITMGHMAHLKAAGIPDKESAGITFKLPPKLMLLSPTSPSEVLKRLDELGEETQRVVDGKIKSNADFLSDPPALRNKLFWDVAASLAVRNPAA